MGFFLWFIGFILDGYLFVRGVLFPVFRFYLPKYLQKHWYRKKDGRQFQALSTIDDGDDFEIEMEVKGEDDSDISLFRLPTNPLYQQNEDTRERRFKSTK